ncbi:MULTISPECIES: SdrD B-like domain-containing protein [unclassified Amycolatopsis]|uniref:MSCRAMM family protein n=1 Tax=unclassified Amycolatopsis TaxID=2618356 RepID=UPI00287B7831|nr:MULTISPECIES: SdrD B-like domain-containing protein [unclassified Amycolatopsis]
MSRTPLRGVRRLCAVLATVLTAGAFVAPAAHADGPSLLITASVGAGPQLVAKPFPITLTLTNTTDQPLTKVTLWDEHLAGSWLSIQDWAGLGGSPQAGVTIDAGATRTFTITAAVWSWNGAPQDRFRGPDAEGGELAVPMVDPTTTQGPASGVLYGDRNENGAFDAGEGLPGAIAYLYGTSSGNPIEVTTDADGRFAFTGLPAQRYGISSRNLPDGWVYEAATEQRLDVDGSDPGPVVQLRAVRPFSEKLHATGSFDRGTYQVGDSVQVTFTVTNVSAGDLHGITLGCDRFGGPDHLLGWDGWNDITAPGSFDLAAGETRTFTETGTVPSAAPTYGGFYAACDFGIDPGPLDGRPEVDLYAHVAAPPAATGGVLYHDDNANYAVDPGEAITGATAELVDRVDGAVTATAVSDAQGHVAFGTVPAGPYIVRIDGWRPFGADGASVTVGTCWYCGEDWALRYQR